MHLASKLSPPTLMMLAVMGVPIGSVARIKSKIDCILQEWGL